MMLSGLAAGTSALLDSDARGSEVHDFKLKNEDSLEPDGKAVDSVLLRTGDDLDQLKIEPKLLAEETTDGAHPNMSRRRKISSRSFL